MDALKVLGYVAPGRPTMVELRKADFKLGDYEFAWMKQNSSWQLLVRGGFLGVEEHEGKSFRGWTVNNTFQVAAAITTGMNVMVSVGNRDEKDEIEFIIGKEEKLEFTEFYPKKEEQS